MLPWEGSLENLSRRARQRTPSHYESAIVPAIAHEQVVIEPATIALADRATVAITRFDAQESTNLLPFIPLLLRGESVASSRIVQLTASSRKIFEAEISGAGSRNAQLIVANVRQMRSAIEAEEINLRTILEMHRILLREAEPDIAGRVREQAVWIGGPDAHHPGGALFVPPHHVHIPELLQDLEAFICRDDVPALAQAAIAHAQFETIHPFADGNGRTGRALIHVLLKARGLSLNGPVPLSVALLHRVNEYFAALDSYRDGRLDPIVRFFAEAALEAVEHGTWLAGELRAVMRSWGSRLQARSDALAWRVLELLLQRPVLTTRIVAEELGATTASALNALTTLEKQGILVDSQLDKRTRAWRAPELLELLDDFADLNRRSLFD
ncbi:filamentation induced by cAMP protein fic [Corynebacterium renale]|uniref:Fic family protein n=2 Tax=Corynebacterium renale TaxID=1724 RepID=A0A2A9DP02_9CORY|nr:Fic family protein [Corynebacterium renale]SQI21897.1 filamentation induced by cAMP protein fic [Corynebacterium renale]